MSFWKKPFSLSELTRMNKGTAAEHLGIEFLEIGEKTISARLPVDHRTRQPFGVIHGGVNVVLAETLGSCAAYHASAVGFHCVGLDINANHIASVKTGYVTRLHRRDMVGVDVQTHAMKPHGARMVSRARA